MSETPEFEHWTNTGRGMIVLSCINADGSKREEPVRGRGTAIIKPEDRRNHSALCQRGQNHFLTGALIPANEAAARGLAEQQVGGDGYGAFSNLPAAQAAPAVAPPTPAPAEQPGTIETGGPLTREEIQDQLDRALSLIGTLQAQLDGAPPAAAAAPATEPEQPIGNVDEVAQPSMGGTRDEGYQVVDGGEAHTVPPAPRPTAPATPAAQAAAPLAPGTITPEEMRAIADDAPGDLARELLGRCASAVQVEQVLDLARQLGAPQKRTALIQQRLSELNPMYQPTGKGPRTVSHGAGEPGPQAQGMPSDDPSIPDIVGPGQEQPMGSYVPGEAFETGDGSPNTMTEGSRDDDAPPPQPLPASMGEFADIDDLVT